MKCFYHPQLDAVAICKNCNKALCADCATDVGNGMACKGKCEADVIAINKMIQHSRDLTAQFPKTNTQIVFWLAVLGSLITVINLINWLWGEGASLGYAMTGGIILLMAFFYHTRTRKQNG